jgi:hypothetical protein
MTTLRLMGAVLLIAVWAGCDGLSDSKPRGPSHALEIHLQNSFDGDAVRVTIDDMPVFAGAVTTDYVWSLAKIIELERPQGSHRVTVVVNETHRASATVTLDRPLYLGVRFYPEPLPRLSIDEGVVIDVTDQRFVYD